MANLMEFLCNPYAGADSEPKGDCMLNREDWLRLARKLDWEFSYTTEQEVFPQVISGHQEMPCRDGESKPTKPVTLRSGTRYSRW
jgi:hypothetical protein